MQATKNTPSVLMISKPVVPPWDDSAKNIVRSQVIRGERYRYRVLVSAGAEAPAPHVEIDPIYPGAGTYSAGLKQNIRVMMHGLRPGDASIYHYFFAPNTVSSFAGRAQKFIARVKTVQTVCSAPASYDGIGRLLFADRVIVLSEDTRRKMINAGIATDRLRLVRPCIEPIEAPDESQRRGIREAHGLSKDGPVVVFPGDYEFSSAARTVAEAVPAIVEAIPDVTIVFACRIKREASLEIRDDIRKNLVSAGFGDRVSFLERVDDMPTFVGAADLVVMPAESLYAKMDVPLVLLEAMAQGVPLVLAESPPLDELLGFGVGLGVGLRDAQGLAAATKRILGDRAYGMKLGTAGVGAVAEIFSAKAMARAIEDVYDEVLQK
jgi:glycosyltransferase involved in cell wall biosynthesis